MAAFYVFKKRSKLLSYRKNGVWEGHGFQGLRKKSPGSYQGAPSGAPHQHKNRAGFSRGADFSRTPALMAEWEGHGFQPCRFMAPVMRALAPDGFPF